MKKLMYTLKSYFYSDFMLIIHAQNSQVKNLIFSFKSMFIINNSTKRLIIKKKKIYL